MGASEWVPLASNIIFSVAVAWYLLSNAIPKMQKQFSEDLKTQRDDYLKALEREKAATKDMLSLVVNGDHEMLKRNTEQTERILTLVQDLSRDMKR